MAITYRAGNRLTGLSDNLLRDCKAHYNFEQTSGSLTNQVSSANSPAGLGSAANGTANGSLTQNATGHIGTYAWDFDGTDDYVELGSSTSQWNFFHAANYKWTINVWLDFDDVGDSKKIFATAKQSSNIGVEWTAENANGNIRTYDTSQTSANIGTGWFQTGWHMYTITGSAEGTLASWEAYRDGVLIDTASDNSWGGTSSNASYSAKFGVHADVSTGQFFDGSGDNLSVWSRVLSADEIKTLYNNGNGQESIIDIKPTNTPNGSTFTETDTGKEYILNYGAWIEK